MSTAPSPPGQVKAPQICNAAWTRRLARLKSSSGLPGLVQEYDHGTHVVASLADALCVGCQAVVAHLRADLGRVHILTQSRINECDSLVIGEDVPDAITSEDEELVIRV
jgi:hypothetical protein